MESGDTLDDPLIPEVLQVFKALEFTSDQGQEKPNRPLTVYRGGAPDGLAWSRSLKTARWFTRRWERADGYREPLYRATAPPEAILALLDGRSESEVVVDPRMITAARQIE